MTWEELSVYAELVAKANKKQRQLEALFNDINRNSIHDNVRGSKIEHPYTMITIEIEGTTLIEGSPEHEEVKQAIKERNKAFAERDYALQKIELCIQSIPDDRDDIKKFIKYKFKKGYTCERAKELAGVDGDWRVLKRKIQKICEDQNLSTKSTCTHGIM